jgi:Spy/CpxP family protein refolding chaperone
MKMNQWLATVAAVAALSLGTSNLLAQSNNNSNSNNGGRQNRPGRGNFDPAQFQQRIMDNIKESLEVTDDAEWKALEPRVQKVLDLRRQSMSGMGRGMFGRNRGGNTQGDQSRPRGGFFGAPSPDMEALQKAIDGKASNSEMKAAIAKFQESRKAKQAELEKAQADLRQVLTVRQEAIALSEGLL